MAPSAKNSSKILTPISIEDSKDINPETWRPLKQEYLVMVTISILSLMVALDATILVPVLPALSTALRGSSLDAFWAGTSYLLTSAVFQPFIAALSDVFGRQPLLLLSVIFFTSGTLICCLANDFTVLFVGRSIQGIGGGGIVTMGNVIFSDMIPLRQRPKYFSIVLLSWAIGTIVGPIVGGALVNHLTWRWIFYLNFPFCFIGLIMTVLFVKMNNTVDETFKQKLQRVDWIGSLLFITGITSILIGISWGGIQFKWSSAYTIVPIAFGLYSIWLCAVWEVRFPEPVLRGSLFCNLSAVAAYYCAFAQGFLLFSVLYYIPFYFMSVKDTSAIQSGINLLPMLCLIIPGAIVVALITSRINHFRWAIWCGWLITTAGAGLFILLDIDTKTPVWAGIFVVFGVGNGISLTSVNIGIQAISKSEDCGRAASMYTFVRSLGMSVGVAVGSTVFQNFMSSKLKSLGLPTAIANASESFIAVLRKMDKTDPVRQAAEKAYIHGFQGIFIVMTCVSGTALLTSLLIRHFSMNRSLYSEHTMESRQNLRGGELSSRTLSSTQSENGYDLSTSGTLQRSSLDGAASTKTFGSKVTAVTAFSYRNMLYMDQSNISANAASSSHPSVILLFSWTGALSRHVSKYVQRYAEIYPNSPVLVIETSFKDFFLSSETKQRTLRPTLHAMTHLGGSHGDILVHCFSDGGSSKAVEFAEAYHACTGKKLPCKALCLDSTPSSPRYWNYYAAIMKCMPYNWIIRSFLKLVTIVGLAILWTTYKVFIGVKRDPYAKTRMRLEDEQYWSPETTPRLYLFSEADEAVDWKDVERHGIEAARNGVRVQMVRFQQSKHCNHIKEDGVKYWEAVRNVWEMRDVVVKAE